MTAFPEDSFLVGLSSIHWREAWKYGERAFRYCQHDVGHALGTLRFAAAALGWKLFLLDRVDAMSQLLGLNRDANYAGAEREHPELLAVVVRGNWASDRGLCLSKEVASQGAASRWYGTANVLSPEHSVDWPVIDEVAAATTNPTTAIDEDFSGFPAEEELFEPPVRSGAFTAKKVILGRRSAVSMHRLLELLDLLWIASKRVETRRKVVHAVHEEAQVDAWAPGNSVPRHGSPVSGGHETSEHPEERRRGNCGGCVQSRLSSTGPPTVKW